jgi:hypothetical protein
MDACSRKGVCARSAIDAVRFDATVMDELVQPALHDIGHRRKA